MLRNTTRVMVVCDDCRTTASDDEGDFQLYFDEVEAFRHVTTVGPDSQGPWDVVPPMDLLCPVCVSRRLTGELGGAA